MSALRKPSASLAIREMTAEDIPAVGALAERIWRAHYPSIISHAQIDYMLHLMYAPHALEEQLTRQHHRFWLIYADGNLAGFASASPQSVGHWHIHKFYVDTARHRQGLGRALMQHVIAAMNAKELTLGVNRHNIKAINFYFRQGFFISHLQNGDIGHGFVMEDFIMKRIA